MAKKKYIVAIRVETCGRWNSCRKPFKGSCYVYYYSFDTKEEFEKTRSNVDSEFIETVKKIIDEKIDDKHYEYELENERDWNWIGKVYYYDDYTNMIEEPFQCVDEK